MPPAKRAATAVKTRPEPVETAAELVEEPIEVTEAVRTAVEPVEKPVEVAEHIESEPDLVPGAAMWLRDGGEAVLLRVDGDDALLRCGTLHEQPVRRPLSEVTLATAYRETPRHAKFRREAVHRGEIAVSSGV